MVLRDLTGDADALRALAHPVRLAVLELLGRDGALTASEAGRALGESAGTMSWHLSVLARHGFVVEDQARGRRRPWRLAAEGQRWEPPTDPAEQAAGNALTRLVVDRHVRRIESWFEERPTAPEPWQQAADLGSFTLHLTADETQAVAARLIAIMDEYRDRLGDPAARPEGTAPVHVLVALTPELP